MASRKTRTVRRPQNSSNPRQWAFRRPIRVGAPPGIVEADPLSPKPRIHVINYSSDCVEEHDVEDAHDIPLLNDPDSVTWVNVDGLGDSTVIETIGEALGAHRLVLEDVVNVHQRAKVEEYGDTAYIVARMVEFPGADRNSSRHSYALPSGDDATIEPHRADGSSCEPPRLLTEQISLILGKSFVATFQERKGDCLDPVRERIRTRRGRIRDSGSDYLAYCLIDAILDGYFPVIETISRRLDDLEDLIFAGTGLAVVRTVHRLRGDLLLLKRTAWPHREAINALLREGQELIHSDTRIYLRDCYDHTVQIIDAVETSRDECSHLSELHYAQISIRQNEVMKVMTVMASIFIPLSFVAGIYGMNFDRGVSSANMPELGWAYGYPFALALMASIAVGLLLFFRRKGWFGQKADASLLNGSSEVTEE